MSIGEALTTLILYVRERGDELPPKVERAMKVVEAKDAKLRAKREGMKQAALCPCQRRMNAGRKWTCFQCFAEAPAELREAIRALTVNSPEAQVRVLHRRLVTFAISRRPQAPDFQTQKTTTEPTQPV